MPYRRLPNTDASRTKALKTAYSKGNDIPPFKLPFSPSSYQKIQSFLPLFEHNLIMQKHAYSTQIEKNKEYINSLKKAKLYISHFIQVLNMAIMREEIPSLARKFFAMDENEKASPILNTESEIINWGKILIEGEQVRIRSGQNPLTNPTIAMVKVKYEQFLDAYNYQKTLQKNTAREQKKLAEMRSDADTIIATVWDEVEASFKNIPEEMRREKAKEFGVVYVYRKNEINKINLFEYDNATSV